MTDVQGADGQFWAKNAVRANACKNETLHSVHLMIYVGGNNHYQSMSHLNGSWSKGTEE